jgi:hypothetical protein
MTCVRSAALALLAGLAAVGSLRAQQSRNDRIAAAFAAYDNFQPDQAYDLVRAAVSPGEGPQDSLWFRGVQLLGQILIERNQQSDAITWLRWAFRQAPNASVDSLNFVPELVSAAHSARAAVAGGSPGDSVTRTTWQWVAPGAGAGRGVLRVASPGMSQPVRVLVQGAGIIQSGGSLTLASGTYDLQVAAEGYLTAQVRREVLPGVTTIASFNLTPVGAVAAQPTQQPAAQPPPQPAVTPPPRIVPPAPMIPAPATLTETERVAVQRQLDLLTVSRFGAQTACATSAFVGRSGLLLTTYKAIRGADRVQVELPGGRQFADEVRVTAYDVGADLAVLQIPTIRGDSLVVAASASGGQTVWGFGFAMCTAMAPRDVQLSVGNATPASLDLADSAVTGTGPLINADGALVGFATGPRTAVSGARISDLLDQARRNAAAGSVLTVGQVALRENHAYGSVTLSSDVAGADVRVTPLEAWQWPGTAASGSLPLTFAGPMGRYHIQVRVAGQVQQERDFSVRPAMADRLAISVQQIAQQPRPVAPPPQAKKKGGGGGIVLAILGVGAAGAAVAVLAGKKSSGGGTPPPTSTGSISVSVPNPSVFGLILGVLRGR